jgi:toxin ParE1/3/4
MYQVVISRRATAHLKTIYRYIAKASYPSYAEDYVEAIRAECRALANLPQRGTDCSSIRPNVRIIGFRRSATIAFRITGDTVTIIGVYYRGLNVHAKL